MKKVEKNGMIVEWTEQGENMAFKVFAPVTGWVAIGFNPKSGLKDTNLIMGKVVNGKTIIEDHYIVAFGDHRSIISLGGQSALLQKKGVEEKNGTTIKFSIPKTALDQYHYDLKKGKTFHLLMAYSTHDDFGHHSTMRTSKKIEL